MAFGRLGALGGGFGRIGAGGSNVLGGAQGLLAGEANGMATDFTWPMDAERVAVKTANVTVLSALDSFYSNAGTSPKQVYDATGTMVWSPHNMLLWCENFTVGNWAKTGTPITAAHTIQDDDPAAFEYVQQQITCIVGATYTATVWFTKDAVTSRFPAVGIIGTASFITQINSSTGSKSDVTTTLTGSSTVVSDGTYWKLSIAFTADLASTGLRIYPAHGTTFGASDVAAVGTVTIDKTQFNRGPVSTAYLTNTTGLRMGLAVDYDPVTHACKGLLCEPAAANLILNNAAMSTQSVTVTAVAHTLSIFGTGTVTLTGVSTAGPLVGTGAANRVSLTFTPTAGSLTLTVAGSVTQAQLEIGSVATSPILTGSASVTRAADAYFVLTSAFPFSATASTVVVDCTCTGIDTAGVSCPFTLSDGDSSDQLQARLLAASVDELVRSASATVASGSFVTAGVASHKLALAAQLDDFRLARNGALATADTSGAMPIGIVRLDIGNAAGSLTQSLKGYLRKITYVPRAMTDAQMQSKTT